MLNVTFGRDAERQVFESLKMSENKETSIHTIKNFIIGSVLAKNHFIKLGILPLLKDIISNSDNDFMIIQASDCIGSLSLPTPLSNFMSEKGFYIEPELTIQSNDDMDISPNIPIPPEEENVLQLINHEFHSLLFNHLSNENPNVLISVLRALKNIFSASCSPNDIKDDQILSVASLLQHSNESIIHYSAQFLAQLCKSRYLPISNLLTLAPPEINNEGPTTPKIPNSILSRKSSLVTLKRYQKILSPDYVEILFHKLNTNNISTNLTQTSTLEALAQLSFDNSIIIKNKNNVEYNNESIFNLFFHFFQHSKDLLTKLHSIHCITNFMRSEENISQEINKKVQLEVIPQIIRFIENINGEDRDSVIIMEQAPLILARLIERNSVFQKTIVDSGFLGCIPRFFDGLDHSRFQRVCANRLLLLACICSLHLDGRQILARYIGLLCNFLDNKIGIIRAAACRVIQILSRSLKELRTSLVDAEVSKPLLKLLADDCIDVQITASAALCNLVLAFSSSKTHIIKSGGIKLFVPLLKSDTVELRCNAVWALQNMMYASEMRDKGELLKEFGKDMWFNLLSDENVEIQAQTLTLIRNLVCKDATLLLDNPEETIGYSLDCKQILLEKFSKNNVELTKQCLFIICNICSELQYKNFGMDKEILSHIRNNLNHDDLSIRFVSVLCLINLTWASFDGDTLKRKKLLKEMGFEDILRNMQPKETGRILDQINTCLNQFSVVTPATEQNIDMDMVD